MEIMAMSSLRTSSRSFTSVIQPLRRSISVSTSAQACTSSVRRYSTCRTGPPPQPRIELPSRVHQIQRRTYANSSSPLGTTSSGAAGVSPSSSAHTHARLLAPEHLDPNEKEIFEKISAELQPTKLDVRDVSGGCGSMYAIEVESERFRGLNLLKQQRLVNAVVKEKMDREGWHGVQLRTKVPGK